MYHAGLYGGRLTPIDENELRKASDECQCVYLIMFIQNEQEIYKGLTVEMRWSILKETARKYGNIIPKLIEIDFSQFANKIEPEILEMIEPITFNACNGLIDNIYGNEYKELGGNINE